MLRNLMILALVASACSAASLAWARGNANLSRREIKQMPILERPSRPGHFYGNAVRRKYARQAGPVRQGDVWYGQNGMQPGESSLEQGDVQFETAE